MSPLQSALRTLQSGNRTATTAIWLTVPILAGAWIVRVHCVKDWPGGLLWGMAALAAGAIVGFLFGIPRVVQTGPQPNADPADTEAATPVAYRVQVNTNLEQISDWLTKIIVGLGLINLGKLPEHVGRISAYVGASFGPEPEHAHFACAVLLYFSVMGFALGYLLTRLYLTGAFVAADRAATSPEKFRSELEREARSAASSAKGMPSTSQVEAAERVGRMALDVDAPVVRSQVEDLAREYERTRSSMRAGTERTRRLDDIVRRMRTLGMAARFLLPELTKSTSPGMRLAAVALLEVTPDREYLAWLADRFEPNAERPFIIYHAAVAVCAASTQLEPADVEPHITVARQRAAQLKADSARDQILAEAAQKVEARPKERKPPIAAAG
jgi:hypothetical protein